ncbi:unnamed protein product [Linum trigynum]|uniref:Uncharacterized protein n=1 Tax=Linum trigynum TaxID=586398 RepID=A0AAV2GQ72_9ROSI
MMAGLKELRAKLERRATRRRESRNQPESTSKESLASAAVEDAPAVVEFAPVAATKEPGKTIPGEPQANVTEEEKELLPPSPTEQVVPAVISVTSVPSPPSFSFFLAISSKQSRPAVESECRVAAAPPGN